MDDTAGAHARAPLRLLDRLVGADLCVGLP